MCFLKHTQKKTAHYTASFPVYKHATPDLINTSISSNCIQNSANKGWNPAEEGKHSAVSHYDAQGNVITEVIIRCH